MHNSITQFCGVAGGYERKGRGSRPYFNNKKPRPLRCPAEASRLAGGMGCIPELILAAGRKSEKKVQHPKGYGPVRDGANSMESRLSLS
jgi:hypothetical protein